jgi:7-cyano-7-deazaguanine synthase
MPSSRRRDLVLLSGGLDSTVATAFSHHEGYAAACLSVDYGQRHARELAAARAVAEHYQLPHYVLDMASWGRSLTGSALTDRAVPVPHGHYADESMASTVVPNRNAVLIMAAAGLALTVDCTTVIIGVHAGDHPVYPDCRSEFVTAIDHTAWLGTGGRVRVGAPFVHRDKTAIVRHGVQLDAPLGLSWSCYEGGPEHCGACGTCVERAEAFALAGVADPTTYATTVTTEDQR